jgi:hypothetical protein
MSLKLRNTEKYLKTYSQDLYDSMIVDITRKDRTRNYKSGAITSSISASGDLVRSLKLHKSRKTGIISFNIVGNEYAESVDEGTTTSNPSVSKLIDWLISKGANLRDYNGNTISLSDIKKVSSIAYLIKKSLNRRGIQKTNFITDLINEKIGKLDQIDEPISQDVYDDLENILIKTGYKKTGKERFIITKE